MPETDCILSDNWRGDEQIHLQEILDDDKILSDAQQDNYWFPTRDFSDDKNIHLMIKKVMSKFQ